MAPYPHPIIPVRRFIRVHDRDRDAGSGYVVRYFRPNLRIRNQRVVVTNGVETSKLRVERDRGRAHDGDGADGKVVVRVGEVGPCDPFIAVVAAVAIEIAGSRTMVFVRTHIGRAINDARQPCEVGKAGRIAIVCCMNTGRCSR